MARAGRLRQRVTLQKPIVAPDSTGRVTGYEDVACVWAAVEPAEGRELLGSNFGSGTEHIVKEVSAVVEIRYRCDVQADWRLLHHFGKEKVPYGIVSMESPLSRKIMLEFACRRVDTGDPV